MSNDTFIIYQKFIDPNEARALADLLSNRDFEVLWEDNTNVFDPSFANNPINKEYCIKLKQADFQRADELLMQESSELLNEIDSDYYLFAFSDDELLEVLSKRDEWSTFDFLLAQKLLKERGNDLGQQEIEDMRKDRIAELASPDGGQQWWIIVGYISAILGGVLGVIVIALLGVIIGYHLLTYKKTLPTGDRVYGYSKKDRLHGQIIFVLATVSMTLGSYLRTLD